MEIHVNIASVFDTLSPSHSYQLHSFLLNSISSNKLVLLKRNVPWICVPWILFRWSFCRIYFWSNFSTFSSHCESMFYQFPIKASWEMLAQDRKFLLMFKPDFRAGTNYSLINFMSALKFREACFNFILIHHTTLVSLREAISDGLKFPSSEMPHLYVLLGLLQPGLLLLLPRL